MLLQECEVLHTKYVSNEEGIKKCDGFMF